MSYSKFFPSSMVLETPRATLRLMKPEDIPAYQALAIYPETLAQETERSRRNKTRQAAGTGVPALGICLGHQLCAVALGGHVVRNPHGQQMGLVPTGWLDAAAADPLFGSLVDVHRGVQWNDDIVDRLP